MATCAAVTQIMAYDSNSSNVRKPYLVPVVQSSVLPADCTGLLMISPSEYQQYQQALQVSMEPFDYAQASAIFAFFFSFVVGCWYVSKNIGVILEAVRRW